MRLKKIKNALEIINASNYVIKNFSDYKCNWNGVFNNNNKIEIEIGMGKGDFLIKKSLENPNINFIGIEKYDSVLVSAVKKIENLQINNLLIINADASNIVSIFDKEIHKIYLNFSDPWPKKRHAKRRLTHNNFLNLYDSIFKGRINIELKTDNKDFFEYSIQSFKEHGYKIKEIDLNKQDVYETEYEKKFKKLGKSVNYVSIYK